MNANKTEKMRNRELEAGRPLEELIREQVEQGKSWDEVADALDVSRVTLQSWRKALRLRRVMRPTVVADSHDAAAA